MKLIFSFYNSKTMGQKMSMFVYRPLEYVNWGEATAKSNPDVPKNLESFIVYKLKTVHKIVVDNTWQPILKSICHKIQCISEGWDVPPSIHFTINEKGVVCIKKIVEFN